MKRLIYLFFLFTLFFTCRQAKESHYIRIPENGLSAFLKYDENRMPLVSAHRGGTSYEGYPENCIATFEYVAGKVPAIIECDIALTKDSVLIMMHDNSLDRTTNGTGKVVNKEWAELQDLKLIDNFGNKTEFEIPTLAEVLKWAEGKAILALDVKQGVPFEMVVEAIKTAGAEEYAMVITYSAKAAKRVHNMDRNLVLSVPMRNDEEVDWMIETGIPLNRMVAFTGTIECSPYLYGRINGLGIQCILGTFSNLDNRAKARGGKIYRELIETGVDIIATDRPIEAFEAIRSLIPTESDRVKHLYN